MTYKWTRPYYGISYLTVKRLLLIVEDRSSFTEATILDYDSPTMFTDSKARCFRGEGRVDKARAWLISQSLKKGKPCSNKGTGP